jgi:hypothetical protein
MSAARPEALAGLASLALLGGLGGGWSMAIAGPVIVAVGMVPVILLVAAANGNVRKAEGTGGIARRLAGGFAFAVPFAVLALASSLGLNWNAATAFAGAAIAAGFGAGGLELVRAGCGKVTALLLPGLWSAVLMAGWMLAAGALAGGGA